MGYSAHQPYRPLVSTMRIGPNWRHLGLDKRAGVPEAKAVTPGEGSHM